MSLNRALVFLVLTAAIVTAVLLWNPGFAADPLDSGGTVQREGGAASGGSDTQKSNLGQNSPANPDGKAAGAADENRQAVGGNAGVTENDGLVALRGRLVFADGHPATVALGFHQNQFGVGAIAISRDFGSSVVPVTIAAKSGADGRFVIRVQPGKVGTLRIDGEDVVMAKANAGTGIHVKIRGEGQDLGDVLVAKAASIVGQIVSDGHGVEGVEIVYGRSPVSSIGGMFTDERMKTDEQGRFEIRGLVAGKIRMDTRSPEFLPAHLDIELAAGQRMTAVLISLRQGGVITGTVVDDRSQPVEGATVSASRSRTLSEGVEFSGFTRGESTTTDASGHFRLAGLAAASVELRASKRGFAPGTEPAAKAGQANVVMKLDRLSTVSGVLVDEKGKGIADSEVSVQSRRGAGIEMFELKSGTKTGPDGKFVAEGVAPGPSTIIASGDAHLEARQDIEVRPGETTKGVRVIARRGSTLTVTVLDEKGAPVAGAEVIASTLGPSGSSGLNTRGRRRVRARSVSRDRRNATATTRIIGGSEDLGSAETDANGVAVLRGMPAGEVKITAEHEELALVEPGEADIPDAAEVEAKLVMQRGGFVEVHVVDTQGRPLGEKTLNIIGPLRGGRSSSLGGDGGPPRDSRRGDAKGLATVGPLAPGAYNAALGEDAVLHSITSGISFSVMGASRDIADSVVPFVIKASETTKLELVMPVLTTLNGTVRDAEGPVAGAEVDMVPDGEIRMPMFGRFKAKTDGDGAFEIKSLPSGKYVLSYNRRGAVVPAEKDVILVKNQPELTEDLILPGAVVKLRVNDGKEGFGVEDAKVSLAKYQPPKAEGAAARPRRMMMIGLSVDSGAGGGRSTFRVSSGSTGIQTDEHGRAEIPGVPAGKYTLTIQHTEYAKVTQVITVLGDQVKDLGTIPVLAGCKVRGKIQFAGKSGPLNLATVEISNDSGYRDTTISRDRTFRFSGLRKGTYKVRAQAIGATAWGPAKSIQTNPDAATRVIVVIPKDE